MLEMKKCKTNARIWQHQQIYLVNAHFEVMDAPTTQIL